jgi:hypothetical protein
MIGRIVINVPFAYTFAGLSYYRNRQAGFSFSNHATLILSQNIGIDLADLPKWAKENHTLYAAEMMYSAYLAYCQENYKKPVFSKKKLSEGINRLSEDDLKRIISTWNDSAKIGVKEVVKKKR